MHMTLRLPLIVIICIASSNFAMCAETVASKRFAALVKEFEEDGNPRAFSAKFIELAEQHPRDDVSVKALLWVVDNVRGKADTNKALKILALNHVKSELLGESAASIAKARSIESSKLLQKAFEKGESEKVRALAGYHLAMLLEAELNITAQLKAEPDLAPRVLQYYGKEYGAHLQAMDRSEVEARREKIFAKLAQSNAKVKIDDQSLASVAERALFAIRRLSVGKVAPDIVGEDIGGDQLKLSSFRGKIVMLTFWGHW